jgi:amino acid transporter
MELQIFAVIASLSITTFFLFLALRHKNWLFYRTGSSLYLGFLGVSVITVMDAITSIYYAPAESYRFIGLNAIFFIPLTAIAIAFFAFSMTEIAQILEKLEHKGGGVYNFSYLVFGKLVSLVAAASILVDYVNTAAISSISAIENAFHFVDVDSSVKLFLELIVVWLVAVLNLVGIRENIKVTFALFGFIAYSLALTIGLGLANFTPATANIAMDSLTTGGSALMSGGLIGGYELLIVGIGSTILAYSGIESVLQTQKLTENWKVIKHSYIFLILFIGIITPAISLMALSQITEPLKYAENLIPHFAEQVGGPSLALFVMVAAFFALIFAVNTAMVASVELLTVVGERFSLYWLIRKNKFDAHQKIILFMAAFFSSVILITNGSQETVADMYAIGLVATFVINLAALLMFRFAQGFGHIQEAKTSFIKNLILFVLFLSVFVFLFEAKPNGAMLWIGSCAFMVALGFIATKLFKDPEYELLKKFGKRFDIVSFINENVENRDVHIFFMGPNDRHFTLNSRNICITYALDRLEAPKSLSKNHFILPIHSYIDLTKDIDLTLVSLKDWFPEKHFFVHFGWITTSWRNRLYSIIIINRILKLPLKHPDIHFAIEYFPLKR